MTKKLLRRIMTWYVNHFEIVIQDKEVGQRFADESDVDMLVDAWWFRGSD